MQIETLGQKPFRPIDGAQIVREEYVLETQPTDRMLAISEELAAAIDPGIAGIIAGQMHFNSPTSEVSRRTPIVRVARPTSAYYLVTSNALCVEWARGLPPGVKLHEYIRRIGAYDERYWTRTGDTWTRVGTAIRSGHLADIILRDPVRIFRAALFDSISAFTNKDRPRPGTVEYAAAVTLLNDGTVPITSDGHIVRFS